EEGPDWNISSLGPNGEKSRYLCWKDGAFSEVC
ncbi:MAG: hypothetical protein RLZZ444_1362, partial [Pseudomonadota bacterium]